MPFIDISLPLANNMIVWPGDPLPDIQRVEIIDRGHECNTSLLHCGSHTGTHIDAPYHFFSNGKTVDQISPEILIGPCILIETDASPVITANDLSPFDLKKHKRVLIKTSSSDHWKKNSAMFDEDFAALDGTAADYLINMGIQLIGIDYLSIENPKHTRDFTVHKKLLSRNVIILEGIDLSEVKPGEYELYVLPLKIINGDGAPARALLKY